MSRNRRFNFPLSTLLRTADALLDGLTDPDYTAPMRLRLGATADADFTTLISAVRAEIALQRGKSGDRGTATREQNDALQEVERLTAGARRSAGLAFRGQKVILHSEFQVGVDEPKDLQSELERARLIVTACGKYATQLAAEGWIAADTTELTSFIDQCGGKDLDQNETLVDRVEFTAELTRAANAVYDRCLRVQNAARLQYPSTRAGNEGARKRFLLDEFPPRDRSQPDGGTQGGGPTPPPAPPTPPAH